MFLSTLSLGEKVCRNDWKKRKEGYFVIDSSIYFRPKLLHKKNKTFSFATSVSTISLSPFVALTFLRMTNALFF